MTTPTSGYGTTSQTSQRMSMKDKRLAAAIRGLVKKQNKTGKTPSQDAYSDNDLRGMYEWADMAHAGMAIAGAVAAGGAEAALHHVTGDAYEKIKHHAKKLVAKVKAKRKGATIASVHPEKTPKDVHPANDNAPHTKPKVKVKFGYNEEAKESFNEMMLERSKRLGVADQIAYYAKKVKDDVHQANDSKEVNPMIENRKISKKISKGVKDWHRAGRPKNGLDKNKKKNQRKKELVWIKNQALYGHLNTWPYSPNPWALSHDDL